MKNAYKKIFLRRIMMIVLPLIIILDWRTRSETTYIHQVHGVLSGIGQR
jgi:hypothetical protein